MKSTSTGPLARFTHLFVPLTQSLIPTACFARTHCLLCSHALLRSLVCLLIHLLLNLWERSFFLWGKRANFIQFQPIVGRATVLARVSSSSHLPSLNSLSFCLSFRLPPSSFFTPRLPLFHPLPLLSLYSIKCFPRFSRVVFWLIESNLPPKRKKTNKENKKKKAVVVTSLFDAMEIVVFIVTSYFPHRKRGWWGLCYGES